MRREIEDVKRTRELLEMKSKISEIKNSLDRTGSKLNTKEQNVSEL